MDSTSDKENQGEPKGPRTVFVVHGRNTKIRDSMFSFLSAIDLRPLEWSDAVRFTGKGSPFIGEILDAAFNHASAIVVVFTPDDEARLKSEFLKPTDPTYEKELTSQARPNVIFEAGMAIGRDSDHTVLVEVGGLRRFTDIDGRHVIRLNDSPEARHELANRLETAGCPVRRDGANWYSVGSFTLDTPEENPTEKTPTTDLPEAVAEPANPQSSSVRALDETEERIMRYFATRGSQTHITANEVSHVLNISLSKAEYHQNRLSWRECGYQYLDWIASMRNDTPTSYKLGHYGMDYLNQKGLL